MNKIAIMGASGFVGSRVVEMFHLRGLGEVRPIIRGFGSLARVARFDLDWQIADACDEAVLSKAFAGCEVIVHSVLGHPKTIEQSVATTYRAAMKAGARRIVYLSTASVHGQAPVPGTDESSPLIDWQPHDYNNRKVCAERLLLKEREGGPVEIVILRPGIVFGPRDRWVSMLANELLTGTAYMVDGGKGICNSIYVDNLVHAIHLAMTAEKADREAFLVGDREIVIWADLYKSVADGLGVPFEEVRDVQPPFFRRSARDRLEGFRNLDAIQAVLPLIPAKVKRVTKAALAGLTEPIPVSPWALPCKPAPVVTREMSELHQCRYKLPFDKAVRVLGYQPPVTFEEGCRRSVEWLAFAGYTLSARN